MLTPDDVSRLYDIRDIVKSEKRKILCPLPGHKHANYTPSFSIFFSRGKQYWRCHGCGRHGDVIDLVGYLNVPFYDRKNSEHLKTAINILTGSEFSKSPVAPPPPKPNKIYQGEWKKYFPANDMVTEYALARGISKEILERFKIGSIDVYGNIYMTIPCFEHGVLKGIKCRIVSGLGGRYICIDGSVSGLFNYDGINSDTGKIFVAKGEIAAMVLESLGYTACAPTNGECGDITPFASAFALAKKIVVISDNDPKESTKKQIEKCAQKRAKLLKAELVYPPEDFKDIDEWILAEPESAKTFLDSF